MLHNHITEGIKFALVYGYRVGNLPCFTAFLFFGPYSNLNNLKTCLNRVLQCSLPSDSCCQATLPFLLRGLGLHSSSHSAAAAFLGSCNSTCCLLASQLLSVDFFDLVFPDEDIALNFLKDISSDLSVATASQNDLQATIQSAACFFKHSGACSSHNLVPLFRHQQWMV